MVGVESPDWLPPGFTAKVQNRDGRKVKYYYHVSTGKKYYSKKDVIHRAAEDTCLIVTPQTKDGDDNRPSSFSKVDAISDKTNDSAAWLPNGWTVEERKRKTGPTYKVYTDLSSGSKFYSKAAVTRYLSTKDHADTITKQNNIDSVDESLLLGMPLEALPMPNTGNIHGKKRKASSLVKTVNVDEPAPKKSPQIISMADSGGNHEQKMKGNSLAVVDNVGEPSPEISPQVISTTNTDGVQGKKRKISSFVTVSTERTIADGLPAGWIKEVRTSKSGKKLRTDPFYIDPVSGYIFRSKPDALRYLKTNDIRSCASKPLKMDSDDIKLNESKITSPNLDNEKSSTHQTQLFSGEEPKGGVATVGTKTPGEQKTRSSKQKQANHSSVEVVEERVSSEKLPVHKTQLFSGEEPKDGMATVGTKSPAERKTRSSTRKQANHSSVEVVEEIVSSEKLSVHKTQLFSGEEPKGGVVTVDTKSPAERKTRSSKRKEANHSSVEVVEERVSSEKLSMHKTQLFSGEEPKGGVATVGTKSPAERKTRSSKRKEANHSSVEVVEERVVSSGTSNVDADIGSSPKTDLPKEGMRVMAVRVGIGSPVTDPLTKQQFPESGGTNKTSSRKSQKRMGPSMPLRSSKRLSGSEPEMQSNLDLSERTMRAVVRGPSGSKADTSPSSLLVASDSIHQTSKIEPVKEAVAVDNAFKDVESLLDVNQPVKEAEFLDRIVMDVVNQLKDVEEPHMESSAVPQEPSGEKPLDDGQRPKDSQLSYDFGDSWSDPLEFAFKTLRGELPIEETMTFPSFLGEQLDTTCSKQSQSVSPINFKSEFASKSDSSKTSNAVDPLPASSPSVSAPGNMGFSSFSSINYQPGSESSKKDNSVDPSPASAPSVSSVGFNSFSSFNYQPMSESLRKHNSVDPLPASAPSVSSIGFSSFSGINYQPTSESLKNHNSVDPMPASAPSVSSIGFSSFSGFNYQPMSESSKKHIPFNPLPASSPSGSSLGNMGFSSFGSFNYQLHSESSKQHNAVDPLPASSPSLSALGNPGFSSYSGFNYQPIKDVGKKDSQTKYSP